MKVYAYPCGPLGTNAYVLVKEGAGIIIDPGADPIALLQALEAETWRLEAILLTHAHYDHIAGLGAVLEKREAPVYVHQLEGEWLSQPELNGSAYWSMSGPVRVPAADHELKGDGHLQLGPFTVRYLHTPGHSPGSLSYFIEGSLFPGDLLFAGSIGRVDLPGGDGEQMKESLRRIITQIPLETNVYPGHGPETILRAESQTNPYLLPLLERKG